MWRADQNRIIERQHRHSDCQKIAIGVVVRTVRKLEEYLAEDFEGGSFFNSHRPGVNYYAAADRS